MQNIPTVTDKTTLNPSPTLYPTLPVEQPETSTRSPYADLSLRLAESPETTSTKKVDSSETDSTESYPLSDTSTDSLTPPPFNYTISLDIKDKQTRTLRHTFLGNRHASVTIEQKYIEETGSSQTRNRRISLQNFAVNE